MFTRTLNFNFLGGDAITKAVNITGGLALDIDETIPSGSTNLALGASCAIDVSQLKLLYIVSDQDLVLETNSGGSPVNVFTLAAGVPFAWHSGMPALRDTAGTAVTTDITGLFATVAGATDAILQIRTLIDPTV